MSKIIIAITLISLGKFFDKNEVKFWGKESTTRSNSLSTKQSEKQTAEEFINNPTKENAIKYLKAQDEKLLKIKKALEVLQSIKKSK